MTLDLRFKTSATVLYGDLLIPPRGKPMRVEFVRKTKPGEYGNWHIWANYVAQRETVSVPEERQHKIRRITTSLRWIEER